MVGAPSLRQSSRTKKLSKRAEEMQQAENEGLGTTTSKNKKSVVNSKSKAAKVVSNKKEEQNVSDDEEKSDPDDGGEYEQEEEGDYSQEEDEHDAEENDDGDAESAQEDESQDNEQAEGVQGTDEAYCVCRKGDNGKPMVFCAECNEWFHFKCVNLTKKVAETLSEYVCPDCNKKTGKVSKTLDDINVEAEAEKDASVDVDTAASSSPPRRPSYSSKRKSVAEEPSRKRSRGSPYSPTTKKPGTTVSSEPIRKASVSQVPKASQLALKARSDTLRKHALEQLVSMFDAIFAESITQGEGKEEQEEEEQSPSREYGVTFEASLFDLHGESTPMTTIKTAGKLYRERLRTFLFNLKDKSNTTLRQKIASKELLAKDLASMSNEELANDEIRKEVERRKRENLEQSILKKEKAPLRKLTHKGEIDIEYEAVQSNRIAEDNEQEREIQSKSKEGHEIDVGSGKDREAGATSPPDAVNVAPALSPVKVVDQRVTSSLQSPSLPFDFTNVWTGEAPREEDGEAEEGEGSATEYKEEVNMEESTQKETGEATEEHADNFIDDFLGMPEDSEVPEVKETAGENKQADGDDDDEQSAPAWRGAISMPDEGVFTGKVRQVAGRLVLDEEWGSLFPWAHSVIEGRLPSGSAAPYLIQSQVASRTELVVMSLEQSWEPNSVSDIPVGAPTNEEENKESFNRLLSYFQNRDRYGVLPSHPAARGRFVKDFYMVPLPKHCNIPQWLELMQAQEFQGEARHTRKGEMFLLVAVLFKQVAQEKLQQSNLAFSPPGQATSPSAALGALLGGSNTLQDLLKAVGGSRSPATPLAAPGYQSPATQAAQATAVANSHTTFESLSEMPKPQLEDMLNKNPNLVDDLLKKLSGGGITSASASPRPPGPPPPPPSALQGAGSSQRPIQQYVSHYPPAEPSHAPSMSYPGYGSDYTAHNHHQQQQQYQQQSYPSLQHNAGYPLPPQDQAWRPDSGYPVRPTGYGTPQAHMNYGPPARGFHRGVPPPRRGRY